MTFQQFQEEYQKLKQRFPRHPNYLHECENSEYGNYMARCKNAYFCFEDADCTDITYIYDSFKAVDCCDGDYVIESEKCYDCVDAVKAYNCAYIVYCARIYDSYFCWDCDDSNNLFGCVHLHHKSYCIFNKQYSKEEYEKKVAELLKRSPEENFKEMDELSKKFPITQSNVMFAENSDYCNQVFHSKNMYMCFDAVYGENCGYLYDSHHNKNSYDLTQTHHSELVYECIDGHQLYNCFMTNYCGGLIDSGFCENCMNSHDLFGCANLDTKEYCILNKQYSKEEYEKQVKEIMSSYREVKLNV